MFLLSRLMGIWWNPWFISSFENTVTPFNLEVMSSTVGVMCLSLFIASFAFHISTHILISPFFFGAMTNGLTQSVGPSTFSIMSNFSSLSSSFSTFSRMWNGILRWCWDTAEHFRQYEVLFLCLSIFLCLQIILNIVSINFLHCCWTVHTLMLSLNLFLVLIPIELKCHTIKVSHYFHLWCKI